MKSMTYEQDIAALEKPEYQSIEGLHTLVNQISVKVEGARDDAVTLLYYGSIGQFQAWEIAEMIAAQRRGYVVTISQTPVAEFLNSEKFKHSLAKIIVNNDVDVASFETTMYGTTLSSGTHVEGFWDIAAKKFCKSRQRPRQNNQPTHAYRDCS